MNVQFLMSGEQRAFAVIPIDEFDEMKRRLDIADKQNEKTKFPLEVVEMSLLKGYSLIKAWRLYLNRTQKETAANLGMTQSAFSQIEKSDSNHTETLKKIANVFGIQPEQLT